MKNRDYLNISLPLEKRIKNLVSLLTLEEKIGLIPTKQAEIPRLNIKSFNVGSEIARGYVSHNDDEPATVFPQPIGMASMFDTELMEKLGEVAGTELRYYDEHSKSNHLVLFGPTVDLCRDPRWGRTEECYGEDPFLAGQMVKAYTKGIVGDNEYFYRAIPSLKHFYANNNEKDRTFSSSNIEPRTKYEYYYRAFKPAIKAGYASGVMTSYNSINGLPAMINPDIDEICKKQWGMKYALTDGSDVVQTVTHHHFTGNHAETLAMAIKNGTDIMCENAQTVIKALKYALKNRLLTERELDKAVFNALYPRFLLGEFNPQEENPYSGLPSSIVNCFKFKALNLRAAREAVTLLKNSGLLPLDKKQIKRIALLGVHAKENFRDWYTGATSYNVTILDAFKNLLPDAEVFCDDCRDVIIIKSILTGKYLKVNDDGSVTADGEVLDESCQFIKCDWGGEIVLISVKNGKYLTEEDTYNANGSSLFLWFVRQVIRPSVHDGFIVYKSWDKKSILVDEKGLLRAEERSRIESDQLFIEEIIHDGIMRANKLARTCDYAVVCVGNDPMLVAREDYDRESIELPRFQTDLVKSAFSGNHNTVMCIVSSYPYAIPELNELMPAIIYTAHGGAEMGNAVAETILGLNNPAGRTPITWYRSTSELPDIMNYDIIKNKSTYLYYDHEPLYPFGYGLSYSEFRYSNMNVSDTEDFIYVSFAVDNISPIDGEEVVQLYISELGGRYKRPLKQLCGFERRFIEADKQSVFKFTVNKKDFGRWDVVKHDYSFDEGEYLIYAGGSSADVKCSVRTFLLGEKHIIRDMTVKTLATDYDDKRSVEIRYTSDAKCEYVKGGGRFGGSITFYDCSFDNADTVKFKASTNGNGSSIKFMINGEKGEEIASFELPEFVEPEKFLNFEVMLNRKITGVYDLVVMVSDNVNLFSIKFK